MEKVIVNLGKGWCRHEEDAAVVKFRGTAFHRDVRLDGAGNFAHLLTAAHTNKQAQALLATMNGFYAWVDESPNRLRAGVDHVRSIPLFYGQRKNEFYLSDDAEWVRMQLGDTVMHPEARSEFLLSGYVTGSETLFPNVKQLQAGEWLEVTFIDGVLAIARSRFYRFLHGEPELVDDVELRKTLSRVTVEAINRLIRYANGRQILLPLSGGYDSRLIATKLKQAGYGNVLCFTYGLSGNKEAVYSKTVAESLGFRWEFIEYSGELWKREWAGADAADFRKRASNHCSLPCVQDWLAIKQLRDRGIADARAVVVPGHTGDFVSGGHIPSEAFQKNSFSDGELFQAIINRHLSNAPIAPIGSQCREAMALRVRDRIRLAHDGSAVSFANLYELWVWQERQAKYIVNSVRVYDQFDLDWWMPLWDVAFIEFWQRVPLELREGRNWYIDWVQTSYAGVAGPQRVVLANAGDRSRAVTFLIAFAKDLLHPWVGALRGLRSLLGWRHPLAFESIVDPHELKAYYGKGYNILGIYSELFIKGRW